jgi:uncharacterized membrane protein YciS (DUF1049 family)
MMKFFLLVALTVAVVIGAVSFQNPDIDISLKFIKWTITEPIAIIIAVPFGVGLIIGMALIIPGWMKKAKQARTNKKKVGELEEELAKAQDQVEQLNLTEEELPEETDEEEDERKGPGDIF